MSGNRSSPTYRALLFALLAAAPLTAGDSLSVYGKDAAGSAGVAPRLWANLTPRPGTAQFALLIDRGLGGAIALPVLAAKSSTLSVAGLPLNVDPLSMLFLPPVKLSGTGAGQGSGSAPLPLPNLSTLVGASLYTQAFVFDSAASNPFKLSATRGLRIRPALPGLLIAPTSVGGSADPQVAVDLASGRTINFSGGRVNNGEQAVFTKGGRYVLIPAALGNALVAYDARTWPPKYLASHLTGSTRGRPWSATVTPDGLRVYLVKEGPKGTPCEIETLWAVPGTKFLAPFPGGPVSLTGICDALNLVFTPDGNTAFLAVLGLISGGGRVLRIDTKPGSATYNKVTGSITFPGKFCWGIDITKDGSRAYAIAGGLGSSFEIGVIDVPNFRLVDMDPVTPGIQNLGGERGVPRTRLARQLTNLVCGPRGRYLYTANFGSISRVVVDPNAKNFKTVTTVTSGMTARSFSMGLALTDAGDRLYVGLHTAGNVLEFDTATMKLLRTFTIGRNVTYIGVR